MLQQVSIGPATREEGVRRLLDFVPISAREYRDERNYDRGPRDRSNTSLLSPWIRHRLITESEVVAAVLRQHEAVAADKFIQEVCWRTYWKGWLEQRPTVWSDYRFELDDGLRRLNEDYELSNRVSLALQGRTDIDCFNEWVHELKDTGYLHNHARLWFASIWIFTLKLPWAIGADFFLRYLLDGDPASNTLSWRWVAGLQTEGKHYLATAENIARFTGGRFANSDRLAVDAPPLTWMPPPSPRPLPRPEYFDAKEPTALLLSEEDLSAGDTIDAPIQTVGAFMHTSARSPLPVSEVVKDFVADALDDALVRSGARHEVRHHLFGEAPSADFLIEWAKGHGCRQIVMPYVPVGPVREWVDPIRQRLANSPIRFVLMRRVWDSRLWPLATKGYYPFKKQLDQLLCELV